MKRLILATGIPELEEALRPRVTELFAAVETVLFLQALTIVAVDQDTTVLLSDAIQNSGVRHIIDVVDYLRRQDVRIVYIGEGQAVNSPFVHELLSRSVYDLILRDDLSLNDIVHVLEHPSTYADVAHLVASFSPRQTSQFKRTFVVRNSDTDDHEEKRVLESRLKLKIFHRREKVIIENSVPKTIIITGLPGSGVSYVALQTALKHAQTRRVALIEASDRPTYVQWLNGPTNDDGANELATKRTPERAWWYNENLRIYAAISEGPGLKSLLPVLDRLEVDTVIIDSRIEDVRSYESSVDVLVVPPDPAKIGYAADVEVSEIVVNMTPKNLPVELDEYGRNWPGASIRAIPWMEDQALNVVSGRLNQPV